MAVLAFAWGHVNPDGAQADGPAMSLGAPGTVFMGVTFQVTVSADPAPDVEFAGLGSEVLFPEELKYTRRDSCGDELQVERADGGAIALCNSFTPILTGGAAHAVLSEFVSGAAALDVAPGSTTPLLELDFVCNTAGSYTLILTAVPESPDGALYGAPDGSEISVKTVAQDYDADGDTTPETHQVADALTIECSDEPPPTDTPEPTDIPPTDAPTDVPEATSEPTIGGPDDGVAGGAGGAGANAGLWVLIGAMLAASVAGMTAFGWRFIRVR